MTAASEPQQRTVASPDPWEAAYLRFETPEQEIRKFISRLQRLGAQRWPREAQIVELFCGRGNGLKAFVLLRFTPPPWSDPSPLFRNLQTRARQARQLSPWPHTKQ